MPAFPADATTITSRSIAYFTAAASAASGLPGWLRLTLMIRAPASTAYRIPAAIRPGLAEPFALTRIGITRQPQQCPAIPIWLLPRAAITLATREP